MLATLYSKTTVYLSIMVLPLALVTIYLATLIRCHGVITRVQGLKGSPLGVGFQGTADSRRKSPSKHSFHTVNPNISRECIDINPCQQDTAIIRDAEIKANAANQCGRTELGGNIDVGENTENAIKEKQVTQVKSGSNVTVTVHQVNADGAGPYTCDLDETSNTGKITHVRKRSFLPSQPSSRSFCGIERKQVQANARSRTLL